MSVTKSCRVPEPVSERLAAAAEEGERLESELLMDAIRLYESVNPHGYAAFEAANGPEHGARVDLGPRDRAGTYDPVEEI